MRLMMTIVLFLTFTSAFAASKVHFVKPANNEVVAQTFDVEFAVDGMAVAKAGDLKEGTGHHHLIIDGKAIAKGEVIKKDENHKHFGDGASKTSLTLKPGKHTLTLQFADGIHKSYGEEYSSTITVTVK